MIKADVGWGVVLGPPQVAFGGRVHADVLEGPPIQSALVIAFFVLVALNPSELDSDGQGIQTSLAVQQKIVVRVLGSWKVILLEFFDHAFSI